jgi:bifunctional DNase/RNase
VKENKGNASPIENYLTQLARELGAGKEFTPRFITEARDHLLSSARHYEQKGLPRDEAEKAAIKAFGSTNEIAGALRRSGAEGDRKVTNVMNMRMGEGRMLEMKVLGIRMVGTDVSGIAEIKDVSEADPERALKEAIAALRSARSTPAEKVPAHIVVEGAGLPSPVVILEEKEGDRLLAIFIGAFEATAIAFALQGVETHRPMTHDLLAKAIESMDGVEPARVVITGMAKGTYFAQLELHQSGRTVQIDARPSDAIAVAVRLGLPVFVNEDDEELVKAMVAAA